MRILVSGHTGFIGSAISAKLNACPDVDIIGASRSNGMNLLAYETLSSVSNVDKILHLAGTVGVEKSWADPGETFKNNLIQTLNLLEFARQHRTPFVFVSSYVYGPPQYLPVDENHPVNCTNPYAASKRQAEMLCEAYAENFHIPVTILRPFNIYGPNKSSENIISHIIQQAKINNCIKVRDLEPKRDYLYIDDLTEALVKVVRCQNDSTGVAYYNIGCGRSFSVGEVIEIVIEALGHSLPVKVAGVQRRNEIRDCFCDFSRFAGRFDWQPEIDINTGIRRILDFEHPGMLERSVNTVMERDHERG